MVTGRLPFSGETPTETIYQIQQKDPPPMTRFVPDVPAELERIVNKSLAKDRDDRYQTARDLLIDLRNLKRKLDVDAEIDRTTPPENFRTPSTSSGLRSRETVPGSPTAVPENTTHPPSNAEYLVTQIRKHQIASFVVVILVIIGAVAGVLLLGSYLRARSGDPAIKSIAVLPFDNQNRDQESEYLADGLTENIINSLSQLPNVKVIARSSAFRYKGVSNDPQKAGKELGVEAVLTGRVLQRGDTLVVGAELVNVADNTQFWGAKYSRKLSEIPALQGDMARDITERLRWRLSGEQKELLAKRQTQNSEAYQLYVKGRYYFFKNTLESMSTAATCFNQAIDKDPNYALAYAGLADTYYGLADVGYPPRESMPRMKAAVQKALEIDERVAEAHTSLAIASYLYDWDWATAEKEFKRAIEINPGYAFAHHQYAWFLVLQGRTSEGLNEFNRARDLDPLNLPLTIDTNLPYVVTKDYDQALMWAHKGEEMDPNFHLAHFVQGWIYAKKGDYAKAIAKFQRARQLENQPWIYSWLGYVYAASGDHANAEKIIAEFDETAKQRYVSPYFKAQVYAGLKDKEKTLEHLEKACEDKSVWLSWLKIENIYDFLRSEPRFQEMQRRVGLPP
jgi:TolB-like protein/tetratricopeptide (TPR) repeat protein